MPTLSLGLTPRMSADEWINLLPSPQKGLCILFFTLLFIPLDVQHDNREKKTNLPVLVHMEMGK